MHRLRSRKQTRQISAQKLNNLADGLEKLLKKAVHLHTTESDSAKIRKHMSRSSQTLEVKVNAPIIESASRIAVSSPTKHPPKLSRDSLVEHPSSIHSPTRIDQFVLGKKLGWGKFSDVYLCMHKQTRTIYAVKTMLKSVISEYGMEAQIEQEYRIQARLDHPNIIRSYAKFEDEFHHFILMEYFHG